MSEPHNVFESALREALARWAIDVTGAQLDQMLAHYDAMVDANRAMNLTRITDPTQAAVKHYADSLAALLWVGEIRLSIKTVLDVGTGAGFPAVPLAVMRPGWDVTAIDGTRKKVDFLRDAARTIGIDNLVAEHAHSSHWRPHRRFDLVVARAVGPLGKCLPAAVAHVRPGGTIMVYKTPSVLDEMPEVEPILRQLRLKPLDPFAYQLSIDGELLERLLVPYRRVP